MPTHKYSDSGYEYPYPSVSLSPPNIRRARGNPDEQRRQATLRRLAQARIAAVNLVSGGVLALGVLGGAQAAQVKPGLRLLQTRSARRFRFQPRDHRRPHPRPRHRSGTGLPRLPLPHLVLLRPRPPPRPRAPRRLRAALRPRPPWPPQAARVLGPPCRVRWPTRHHSRAHRHQQPRWPARAVPHWTRVHCLEPESQPKQCQPTRDRQPERRRDGAAGTVRENSALAGEHHARAPGHLHRAGLNPEHLRPGRAVGLTAQPTSQKATFTEGCTEGDGTSACTVSSVSVKHPVVLHAQIAVASSAASVKPVRLTATASIATAQNWKHSRWLKPPGLPPPRRGHASRRR